MPSAVPDIGFAPTVPVLARRAAELYGERDLIVMADRRATFAEIEAASRALARKLLGAGVGKGTRVGLHFTYSPEFLVAWLAAARIGALLMPLSSTYAPGEMRRVLRRADIDILLTPRRLLGRDQLSFIAEALPELTDTTAPPLFLRDAPLLRRVWLLGASDRPWATSIDDVPEGAVDDAFLAAVEHEVTPADWLVVIHTSGTTAEPKGVIHTHGAVVRKTASYRFGGEAPTAVFAAMPLFWVGGLITLTAALALGTTMVCQERFQVDEALDLIERERCTMVSAWLSVTQALRSHPSLPSRRLDFIPSLTQPAQARPYGTPLGMTESIGPHMTVPHPEYGMEPPAHLRGSLGVKAPFYDHKLVDPQTRLPLPAGDGQGEICIRGYATLAGIYRVERHEVYDDDGYYPTGDIVRLEDGLYFFAGRSTEMIKTHGANVAPPEVEAVLEARPEVRFAFVVGVPDAQRGEQVAAAVVPTDGHTIAVDELRAYARAELSSYKVPRIMRVMAEGEVPWLATGKPDRRRIRDILAGEAGRALDAVPGS